MGIVFFSIPTFLRYPRIFVFVSTIVVEQFTLRIVYVYISIYIHSFSRFLDTDFTRRIPGFSLIRPFSVRNMCIQNDFTSRRRSSKHHVAKHFLHFSESFTATGSVGHAKRPQNLRLSDPAAAMSALRTRSI